MQTEPPINRSPMVFFLWVFILSIPFWVVGVFLSKGLPLPLNLPVSSLMGFCPIVVALVLVHREEGASGIKRLWRRIFHYKGTNQSFVWHLTSILVMPVIMLLSYWTMRKIGLPPATTPHAISDAPGVFCDVLR